ncbi:MAG: pre-peptidase C-terminal domain-containing protein [Sulfurovum sp.]|nr:pre-peptidase C-terminal domain-containing protein [Sulfurovum sp.]
MKSYLQWSVATIVIAILGACGSTNSGNRLTSKTISCTTKVIRHKGLTYGCVASKTGRIWLDRNLGASRVATSLSDAASYGYYFQWGRPSDGHQRVSSDKRHQRAITIHPSFSPFIAVDNNTTDWVADGVDDNGSKREVFLWKTDGTGICPKGFRVPTAEELIRESYRPDFNATLKFPLAGFRNNTKNSIEVLKSASNGFLEDASGYYMASDKSSSKMARILSFNQGNTGKIETKGRAYGYSVRCIQKQKDEVVPSIKKATILSDDHSNRIDTATSIDLNSTTLGHINKVGDVDWFKIVIPRTGTLVVETTDTTDTKGYLYNASGVQLASNDNISSSNHNFKISKFITVAGTYYVKVRHSGTTGTGIYALVSHFIPNDYGYNVNTATPIALKSTTRGRIEAAGSGDYFKIIIPSGKRGTLIINTTGSTDTYGSLLGGSGAQLALDDNSGSGHNFRISISVTAGTYYAKVRHHSPTGIGSYVLVSHFVPDDHTSSRIAATSINPNSTTQGRIEVAGDVDFFKIRIPSSGTLVVKTTGLTDTYGTLLNANGHQIASDDNGSTYSNFRILKSVSTGTYYVKVKHSSASSIGYYTLISQFISDDYGNTRSTAKPINPNSTTQGRIEVDGDVDFFKIQIHSRGTLVVKTTGLTDTYGTLLNANGHQIASDDNGSAYSNFKISKSVTAGTYYVKVKHSSALLAGSYVLVSHFVSDDDHGDSRSLATSIDLNSTTRGRIDFAGDEDYFEIRVPDGGGKLIIYTSGTTDTQGYLSSVSGREIVSDDNSGSGNNFKISKLITMPGAYYVKVKHRNPSSTGDYLLVSRFVPDDHDDSRGGATPIEPNSITQGRIEVANDKDYFKIQIPSGGTLVLYTTGTTDTRGYLYNASGTTQIAFNDDNGSDQNFKISQSVTAGAYYVKVRHHLFSSGTGDYSLVSEFTPSQ